MGTDSAFPPFEFNDQQGVHSGISADYMQYAKQQLGINLTPRLKKNKGKIVTASVSIKKIDVIEDSFKKNPNPS